MTGQEVIGLVSGILDGATAPTAERAAVDADGGLGAVVGMARRTGCGRLTRCSAASTVARPPEAR